MPANSPESPSTPPDPHRRSVFWGTALGMVSAVAYTAANIFLRTASDCDPLLVSSVKALPTVLCTFPLLLLGHFRGLRVFPKPPVVVMLAATGIFAHFAGNVLFQWSLGVIGIALTVPLCLGTILCGSALLGRLVLLESVTPRVVVALGTLIFSIVFLSGGASTAFAALSTNLTNPWWGFAGVGAACMSGFAYALLGMAIRRAMTREASVAATTFTVAFVGLISLSTVTFVRLGWPGLAAVQRGDWLVMLLAGICNVVAFVALARALQLTTLVYVNALNASQVAMASVAGIVLFGEPASAGLAMGVGLTVVGLLIMPRQTSKVRPSSEAGDTELTEPDAAQGDGTEDNMLDGDVLEKEVPESEIAGGDHRGSTPRRESPQRNLANRASSSSRRSESQAENSASDVESSITPT